MRNLILIIIIFSLGCQTAPKTVPILATKYCKKEKMFPETRNKNSDRYIKRCFIHYRTVAIKNKNIADYVIKKYYCGPGCESLKSVKNVFAYIGAGVIIIGLIAAAVYNPAMIPIINLLF